MADAPTIAAAIVAAAGALGGFIRWSSGRLARSWDNLADVIKANTAMLTKVAELLGRVDVRADQMAELVDEISGVHSAPPAPPSSSSRAPTQPSSSSRGSYSLVRRAATEKPR